MTQYFGNAFIKNCLLVETMVDNACSSSADKYTYPLSSDHKQCVSNLLNNQEVR